VADRLRVLQFRPQTFFVLVEARKAGLRNFPYVALPFDRGCAGALPKLVGPLLHPAPHSGARRRLLAGFASCRFSLPALPDANPGYRLPNDRFRLLAQNRAKRSPGRRGRFRRKAQKIESTTV